MWVWLELWVWLYENVHVGECACGCGFGGICSLISVCNFLFCRSLYKWVWFTSGCGSIIGGHHSASWYNGQYTEDGGGGWGDDR